MASIATAATRAELRTLYQAVVNTEIVLRQIYNGDRSNTDPGRFTVAQVDTQLTALQAALTAATT